MTNLLNILPYEWTAIGTSLLCGTIIGLERQLRGKPVGIRTSSLIVLGTYIFVVTANSVANDMSDPSRIIGQVITGVGFLGAGVMMSKDGGVVGVTSAATIWVLAAIGITISNAHYVVAIQLASVVVAILVGIDMLENYSQSLTKGAHAKYKHWRSRPTERNKRSANPRTKLKSTEDDG